MVLAFGDCRLDVERRELRRGAELIAIEPRALDLLIFLVQNRDRVLSKDDLLQGVWGGRIVSESALTTRINAVRRALGDDGTAQRLVRTFTRKGVRFIGEVTETADQASPAAAGDPPVSERLSIVVRPFDNLTGDPEQDYFVDGMVEEITTAITRFPWLCVIARNSSFAYKGRAVDVREVAHQWGVRYVLDGSVRKSGNRVRITGQLIDTATGGHIWAERFDGTLDDIFVLQDQVASSVVCAIEPRLRLAEIKRASRKPTESLEAYDLYLRGTAAFYNRTRENHAQAIRLLRQALELDPACAPAMARLALCRVQQLARHWIAASSPEVEEGIRMARQALAAGRDDPEVLRYAGYALGYLAGDNETALDALDRAIARNPNSATAFSQRAFVLSWLDRPNEAIHSAQQAIRLSPANQAVFATYTALGIAYMAAGRFEEGLLWADRALRENSGLPALQLKLSLLGHLGRVEETAECLRMLSEIHPEPTIAGVLGYMSKGLSPAFATRYAEGLRKAGVPEGD